MSETCNYAFVAEGNAKLDATWAPPALEMFNVLAGEIRKLEKKADSIFQALSEHVSSRTTVICDGITRIEAQLTALRAEADKGREQHIESLHCESCGQDVTGGEFRPHRYVVCHKPGCVELFVQRNKPKVGLKDLVGLMKLPDGMDSVSYVQKLRELTPEEQKNLRGVYSKLFHKAVMAGKKQPKRRKGRK